MIDNLKKYWFVVVIALVLIVGIGVFSKQQISSVIKGKKVDGKDVVYSIAGEVYTADAYYDALYARRGAPEIYKLFERTVLDTVETTDEIASKSKTEAENVKQTVSAQSGAAGLDQLNGALVSLGYQGLDELAKYYENMNKSNIIFGDYLEVNFDKFVKGYMDDQKPRIVSHILVKMEDSSKPSEAEQEKMNKIDAALKEGKSFSDVAMEFSDDGSAQNGGQLGYMDKSTNFVEPFKVAAMATAKGETTAWVTSEFGRHLIKVDEDSFDALKDNPDFLKAVATRNPNAQPLAIWEKSENLEIKFEDPSVEKELQQYLGIGGNTQ